MLVSWNWLKEYVQLDHPVQEVVERLTMAGLNLESVEPADGDLAIDLEVTSNRPDCLGHVGVAREVGVLFGKELTLPPALPKTAAAKTADATSVAIECEDLCPQYIARVVRGVKIGPSPDWLVRRLRAIGMASVNNVVDVTNYVLMECGQPLHAFDFDTLGGRRIIVRRARPDEKLVAIDQREYRLDSEMCIIADGERPVAIGGVMGGLETEIGDRTVNVLIEVARFTPLSIRNTARKLGLHSPSSYRFERGVDRQGLDWASRRCCELILETAGGELLDGAVLAGGVDEQRSPITLRFEQLRRILGIDVPPDEALRILRSLGLEPAGETTREQVAFVPPSWRRDLTREADLIEEVARIHGYEKIPGDVPVPLQLSARTHRDRVTDRVRQALTAAGYFEAITLSLVSEKLTELFTPHGERPRLQVEHSSFKQLNTMRQSLVPSLLQSRRENERHGTADAHLFEIAKVYLEAGPGRPEREVEPTMITLVSGRPFLEMKGVVQTLADALNHRATLTARPSDLPQFTPGRGAELFLDGKFWGWLGELDRSITDRLDLQDAATVAELDLALLEDVADLIPAFTPLPQYPAMQRDLNFVLAETTTWAELEQAVRSAAGPLLESVSFGGQYRGKQIPADKQSYLMTLNFRSLERTLTADEVDQAVSAVVESCRDKLGAELR